MESLHTIFLNLLAGERPYLDQAKVSANFEFLASRLFHSLRPGYWYDGVEDMRHRRRKERQIIFSGHMWVGQKHQWPEDFEARLTDMRSTRRGIRVTMRIGVFSAEGELDELGLRTP